MSQKWHRRSGRTCAIFRLVDCAHDSLTPCGAWRHFPRKRGQKTETYVRLKFPSLRISGSQTGVRLAALTCALLISACASMTPPPPEPRVLTQAPAVTSTRTV